MGRALDPRRKFYLEHFDLHPVKPSNKLPAALLQQLDACKDDTARRILLGLTEEKERESQ